MTLDDNLDYFVDACVDAARKSNEQQLEDRLQNLEDIIEYYIQADPYEREAPSQGSNLRRKFSGRYQSMFKRASKETTTDCLKVSIDSVSNISRESIQERHPKVFKKFLNLFPTYYHEIQKSNVSQKSTISTHLLKRFREIGDTLSYHLQEVESEDEGEELQALLEKYDWAYLEWFRKSIEVEDDETVAFLWTLLDDQLPSANVPQIQVTGQSVSREWNGIDDRAVPIVRNSEKRRMEIRFGIGAWILNKGRQGKIGKDFLQKFFQEILFRENNLAEELKPYLGAYWRMISSPAFDVHWESLELRDQSEVRPPTYFGPPADQTWLQWFYCIVGMKILSSGEESLSDDIDIENANKMYLETVCETVDEIQHDEWYMEILSDDMEFGQDEVSQFTESHRSVYEELTQDQNQEILEKTVEDGSKEAYIELVESEFENDFTLRNLFQDFGWMDTTTSENQSVEVVEEEYTYSKRLFVDEGTLEKTHISSHIVEFVNRLHRGYMERLGFERYEVDATDEFVERIFQRVAPIEKSSRDVVAAVLGLEGGNPLIDKGHTDLLEYRPDPDRRYFLTETEGISFYEDARIKNRAFLFAPRRPPVLTEVRHEGSPLNVDFTVRNDEERDNPEGDVVVKLTYGYTIDQTENMGYEFYVDENEE